MSPEKAFYYFVAMYGFGSVLRGGGPDDIIELYGEAFDANNYKRAIADEFERNRYKERIRARIADEVSKIDFPFMTQSLNALVKPVRWLANSTFRPAWLPGKAPTR